MGEWFLKKIEFASAPWRGGLFSAVAFPEAEGPAGCGQKDQIGSSFCVSSRYHELQRFTSLDHSLGSGDRSGQRPMFSEHASHTKKPAELGRWPFFGFPRGFWFDSLAQKARMDRPGSDRIWFPRVDFQVPWAAFSRQRRLGHEVRGQGSRCWSWPHWFHRVPIVPERVQAQFIHRGVGAPRKVV